MTGTRTTQNDLHAILLNLITLEKEKTNCVTKTRPSNTARKLRYIPVVLLIILLFKRTKSAQKFAPKPMLQIAITATV